MKRTVILVLVTVLLLGALSACAASGYVDDGRGYYGNVSTTRNGYVNGTNHGGSGRSGVTYTPGTGTQDPYRTTAPGMTDMTGTNGMTGTNNGTMR